MSDILDAELIHAPQMAELHAESFGSESWSLDQFRGSLALATTRGWVTRDGPAYTGFILCQVTAGEGDVLTLCVRPGWRRQGVGERLLRHALEHSFTGAGTYHLEVAFDNAAARRLYERCGFAVTATRRGYYRRGAVLVDGVSYRWQGAGMRA